MCCALLHHSGSKDNVRWHSTLCRTLVCKLEKERCRARRRGGRGESWVNRTCYLGLERKDLTWQSSGANALLVLWRSGLSGWSSFLFLPPKIFKKKLLLLRFFLDVRRAECPLSIVDPHARSTGKAGRDAAEAASIGQRTRGTRGRGRRRRRGFLQRSGVFQARRERRRRRRERRHQEASGWQRRSGRVRGRGAEWRSAAPAKVCPRRSRRPRSSASMDIAAPASAPMPAPRITPHCDARPAMAPATAPVHAPANAKTPVSVPGVVCGGERKR